MKCEKQEDYCVAIPLLYGSKDVIAKAEKEQYTAIGGNASFMNTCFNGLNALSG